MATNKVGGGDAPDAQERDVKTTPELSDDRLISEQDAEPTAEPREAPADTVSDGISEPTPKTPRPVVLPPEVPRRSFAKRLAAWPGLHKKVSIPLGVLLLLGILVAIPATRFAVAGTVLKQRFSVMVVDAETKQPVTSASVRIDGVEAVTDNMGKATAKVAVGSAKVEVSKKYFKSANQNVTVPILKQKDVPQLRLQATGRQVSVKVTNKISKKPLANVTIAAAGTEAKTDNDGKTTLVVPAGEEMAEATLKANGFNDAKVTVQVMKGEADNSFTLTPAGKVYFLSNQSGKLDVVKTNLDGADRQVVLAGTGREDKPNTSLLASRDWRYLALHAKRDSDKPKVYVIDTRTDKLTVVDEGKASFSLTGWSGANLVYSVTRDNLQWNEAKRYALKTFNADTQKLTTIDENASDGGSNYEWYAGVFILDNEIVYGKRWNSSANPEHEHTITSVTPDGKNKKVVRSYDLLKDGYSTNLSMRPYKSQSLYVMLETYTKSDTLYSFELYENGQFKSTSSVTEEQFYGGYDTYLVSPSGNQTFWREDRDGQSTFFIGNKQGEGAEQIGVLNKFNAYAWFSDDYVLLSKDGSQLYVAPRAKFAGEADLTKVADYYRPSRTYAGYGYGGQ